MITREQLELAAKTAGLELYESDTLGLCVKLKAGQLAYDVVQWKPNIDHGQLLDLAMACGISLVPKQNYIAYDHPVFGCNVHYVDCQDFPALAEAVVRAAAEQQLAKEGK